MRIMRHVTGIVTGVLLSAGLFTSCTCSRDVAPPEPAPFDAAKSGFHASGGQSTPQQHVQLAKPTPAAAPAAQVAEVPPTPPKDIPADFPPDVPIFKDASIEQVQDLANDARNVVFNTAAPVAEVYSFYQERMRNSGWAITQQFQRPNHAFVTFKKGKMLANLTVSEDERNPGHQVIAIMYEEEKPTDFPEF
jgi:hypothetical protein